METNSQSVKFPAGEISEREIERFVRLELYSFLLEIDSSEMKDIIRSIKDFIEKHRYLQE